MNYQTAMPDEKLIKFYLNGDSNAMATLVELYKDRVYRSVYNMMQDKYVAEEIFQEVFTRIINNIMKGQSPEEGNFIEWAVRIAQNICIEYSGKNKMAVIINTSINEKTVNGVNFSAPPYLPNTNYHECHGKIKSMIDMLPDEQREVMVLNHYGGLSFKEIADMMKCSLNTALDTMKFGLNNLQKLMTEKEIALR